MRECSRAPSRVACQPISMAAVCGWAYLSRGLRDASASVARSASTLRALASSCSAVMKLSAGALPMDGAQGFRLAGLSVKAAPPPRALARRIVAISFFTWSRKRSRLE